MSGARGMAGWPGADPDGCVRRVEACAGAIGRHDRRLRAFITPTIESALEVGRAADEAARRGDVLGLLHGAVVALKDNIEVAGVRCTAGSAFFAEHVPNRDAPVTERLRRAGAVLIGKTNLHEFAYGGTSQNEHYGRCRNAWDDTRLPGGSSGGSGVAVAAGMCEVALGTDTGGSIRMPASLNGICGLRPTAGAVPNRGSFPVSPWYDTIGPMARRIIDVARIYAAIAGPDASDPTSAADSPPDVLGRLADGIEGVRILMPSGFFAAEAEPEVAAAVRQAAEVLASLGAQVEGGDLPGADAAQPHLMPIIYADAADHHRERLEREPGRFGRDVRARLQPGLESRAIDYARSLRWVEGWRRQLAELFRQRCNLVLTPTMPCTAPPIEPEHDVIAVSTRLSRFTWVWPAAGVPALSVPCGFDAHGLPIGMQLAGPRWSEPLLLRVGHAYQAVTDWHLRRPALAERIDSRACSDEGQR
jgi:aspartyl-tRNA(Asn)/glutamyl-tRNA(Gln) amidotransferase subunit A